LLALSALIALKSLIKLQIIIKAILIALFIKILVALILIEGNAIDAHSRFKAIYKAFLYI
jgi:hypothetical protein